MRHESKSGSAMDLMTVSCGSARPSFLSRLAPTWRVGSTASAMCRTPWRCPFHRELTRKGSHYSWRRSAKDACANGGRAFVSIERRRGNFHLHVLVAPDFHRSSDLEP